MLQLIIQQVDDGRNSDMVHIVDTRGTVCALCSEDMFWEDNGDSGDHGEIHRRLRAGEEVAVNLTIADEKP